MNTIFKTILLSSISILLFSCKKDKVEPIVETPTPIVAEEGPKLVQIGEAYIIGAKAKAVVYSAKAFETGYNDIFVALFDSVDGKPLTEGHFDIMPMMDMGMMQHSCPVENTESTSATNGYFKSSVVFSMAGTASQWSLNMTFHNHKNNLTGAGALGVNVVASTPSRMINTTLALDNNTKVLISLVNLTQPQVGVNDFEITIHKKESMTSFPAIENYTVEVVPEMPSMGHGSPNNVNPVHAANGHYKGKVNFTMTGLWRINLKLYKDGVLISDDQYFETTLTQ